MVQKPCLDRPDFILHLNMAGDWSFTERVYASLPVFEKYYSSWLVIYSEMKPIPKPLHKHQQEYAINVQPLGWNLDVFWLGIKGKNIYMQALVVK